MEKENDIFEKYSSKNILITGGCGFLGSNLAHTLLKIGAKVSVFDIMEPDIYNNDIYHNFANIEDIRDKIELIRGDIRDYESIKEAVADKDIIFHCAAHTSHPQSMKNPLLNMEVNCKGSLNLLEALRKSNSQARLIYTGSSTQIGKKKYEPIDENHPEFPRDIYSANKMVAEKYHLIYNYVYGIPTSVLRIANTYGPRAAIHSPNFGFVNYFIGLALKGKDLTIYGSGEQKRTITYVEDVVESIMKAGISKKCIGETLFICREDSYSIKEIAEAIVTSFGKGKVNFIPWPKERESMEVGDVSISAKKSKELLDWEPKIGLMEGLRCTKDYYEPKIGKYLK